MFSKAALIFFVSVFAFAETPPSVCKTTLKAGLHGVVRDAAGKLIRRTPLGKDPVILDTNIVISIVQSRYTPATAEEYRKKWASRISHMMKKRTHVGEDSHLYMAERTTKERFVGNPDNTVTFPENTRIFEISTKRDSPEYRGLMAKLDSIQLGQVKANSVNDREIVADLFFAKKNFKDDVPTFVTADAGIYGPLCKFNPKCASLAGDKKQIKAQFSDGFDVTLEVGGIRRTIKIMPF